MVTDEDGAPSTPEWIITYGDMMALLLTFFIMLVSMSELKEEEHFRVMLNSIRQQFGRKGTTADPAATDAKLPSVASISRSKRLELMRADDATRGDCARNPSVGVLYFSDNASELDVTHQDQLQQLARTLLPSRQKIEIRGHTSRNPPDPNLGIRDSWDLGYARARSTMHYLVESGVEPERIRIGSAGAFEPINRGTDAVPRVQNGRVEVLVWDEPLNPASN
ncbi:MAG: OmpA family protein [Pirellulales bacterium]